MPTLTQTDRILYAARLAAFLDHHDKAVELLDRAIAADPDDPRLLRYRGHRNITLRNFEQARADFTKAAELIEGQTDEHEFYQRDVEPDLYEIVMGNEDAVRDQHIPVNEETCAQFAGYYKSTLHGSIWYHLAIANYMLEDFDAAHAAFERAAATQIDDDLAVAILDWRYMSLRRAGREAEAAALLEGVHTDEFDVNGTEDFYLRRLRMYTGQVTPEQLLDDTGDSYLSVATQGYGVGNWHYYNGDKEKARDVFEQVIKHGFKNAFGYMAAERDLAALQGV